MNKKILIGSIIAVAILILVSFTGVVGYQTTKSSTIARASPLFTVRSSRAIDEESKDFTCDYIGKDKRIDILLPKRDSKTALVQKFITNISRMSDENLEKLIAFLINHAQSDERFNDENFNAIKDTLYLLRDNSELILLFEENPTLYWTCHCTVDVPFSCIAVLLVLLLYIMLIVFGINSSG